MEREVFMTGIGGQGVQLAAKILANPKHGAHINWLSFARILYYGFSYPFRKRIF